MIPVVVLLVFGIALLWAVAVHDQIFQPKREPVPPLVVPAILCATPWQIWMQRQAEIAELRVEFAAAPYPPRGPGAGSPPRPPSRPSPTEGVRYRSGDGRQDVWLPGPGMGVRR